VSTRVVLAPDKFKGSLTATQAVEAMALGLRTSDSRIEAVACPVADGGEGTLTAVLSTGFEPVPVSATGPDGRQVSTFYARKEDTAIVEMAEACGLGRLPEAVRLPMSATSRGLGDVIAAAIGDGCQRIIVGIGGSASTDGGAGMLRALGAEFFDDHGVELAEGGAALARLQSLRLDKLLPRVLGVEIVIASDVDNPMCGPTGAAWIYGPQKGATPQQANELDRALSHWADVVAEVSGADHRDEPGAGAAGGVGFAGLALLGARREAGSDVLFSVMGLEEKLKGAVAVITGEGSLDDQSLRGKAPIGVAALARRLGVPAYAIVGASTLSKPATSAAGIRAVYELAAREPDPRRCITNAFELVSEATFDLARTHLQGRIHA